MARIELDDTTRGKACPYCRFVLKDGEAERCDGCNAVHHADCWDENGGCAVVACGTKSLHPPIREPEPERIAITPDAPATPPPSGPRRSRRPLVAVGGGFALVALLVVLMVVAFTSGSDSPAGEPTVAEAEAVEPAPAPEPVESGPNATVMDPVEEQRILDKADRPAYLARWSAFCKRYVSAYDDREAGVRAGKPEASYDLRRARLMERHAAFLRSSRVPSNSEEHAKRFARFLNSEAHDWRFVARSSGVPSERSRYLRRLKRIRKRTFPDSPAAVANLKHCRAKKMDLVH